MSISDSASLAIRPLNTWDEYLAAEELQRVVWQMPDWRDAVPANLLITAQKNGGLVLGSFDGARLAGLCFSFVGLDRHLDPPALKQCSHMLAVLPEYQSRKLGVHLKLAQRELTRAQQIALITWTYDPLLALNANLNLVRLGAIARRYIENAYGEMSDMLNAGLASDRFEVEWWLDSPRVVACAASQVARVNWESAQRAGARAIFEIAWDAHQLPRIQHEHALDGPALLVEIPGDLAALKSRAPDLARDWRARTRSVFQRAFAAGYVATNFVLGTDPALRRAAYLLTQETV
ncbi:MAG: hypothetical protein HY782_22810 [Chloroflexi bacterium]|nr:hypothetical protein [Chloroflexota bacterium]